MSRPTPVPEASPLLRRSLALSLTLHLVATFLPWSAAVDPGRATRSRGMFQVSLYEAPGEEETRGGEVEVPATGELTATGAPATEAAVTRDVGAETGTGAKEPAPERSKPHSPPTAGSPGIPGEDPAGTGTGAANARPGGPAGDPAPSEPAAFRPPRLLAGALPIDPEDSEKLDVPEEIPVRLRIGRDGRVKEIVPRNPELPRAVMRALERSARAMRFAPARRGNQPVEAWFSMTFVYRR